MSTFCLKSCVLEVDNFRCGMSCCPWCQVKLKKNLLKVSVNIKTIAVQGVDYYYICKKCNGKVVSSGELYMVAALLVPILISFLVVCFFSLELSYLYFIVCIELLFMDRIKSLVKYEKFSIR